ncbi:MAG: thioesterase family protein [Spirochaetia bacterium]|nr:thioesterase family protein [Spirochaetia bacterium]
MKANETRLMLQTSVSDLDSQKHVNSASYLAFAEEGQYDLLKKNGFDYLYFRYNKLSVKTLASHINFHKQQFPQTFLEIITNIYRDGDILYWKQNILNHASKELSCSLSTISKINSMPQDLAAFSRGIPFLEMESNNLGDFSQTCKRSMMYHKVRHVDLDGFEKLSTKTLWRLNEEARWSFLNETGISIENLLQNDITLFWIEGVYKYFENSGLGEPLRIFSWIDRMDKVRIYFRQEIIDSQGKRVSFTEGKFLCVSITTSKPKRIPEFIKRAFVDYINKPL